MSMETNCLFCDAVVVKGERHHFPIPKRHGGQETHLVCVNCHDLADRYKLEGMPIEMLGHFISLWQRAEPMERIMLWKMHTITLDGLAAQR